MKNEILSFIKNNSFPCVMAKAVASQGHLEVHHEVDIGSTSSAEQLLQKFYLFIDEFKKNPGRLSSFIVTTESDDSFDEFEGKFWALLRNLYALDRKFNEHDPRVSSDPRSKNFSFSIKGEAFFILMLHPNSPRFSRRFLRPSIVFNPHQQFEELRRNGIFQRVRDIIRKRDKVLQGSENPMLKDFGEKSEAYQYTGRFYPQEANLPLFN